MPQASRRTRSPYSWWYSVVYTGEPWRLGIWTRPGREGRGATTRCDSRILAPMAGGCGVLDGSAGQRRGCHLVVAVDIIRWLPRYLLRDRGCRRWWSVCRRAWGWSEVRRWQGRGSAENTRRAGACAGRALSTLRCKAVWVWPRTHPPSTLVLVVRCSGRRLGAWRVLAKGARDGSPEESLEDERRRSSLA